MADPGGARPSHHHPPTPPPPTGSNSFIFAYIFTHIGCQRPPPPQLDIPQREILDPPLISYPYLAGIVIIDITESHLNFVY